VGEARGVGAEEGQEGEEDGKTAWWVDFVQIGMDGIDGTEWDGMSTWVHE